MQKRKVLNLEWKSEGVDKGKPGVGSRDEGKHTGRNDLLFVGKMMWMGERV